MDQNTKPVFFTDSPKRWNTIKGILRLAGALIGLLLLILLFTFFRSSGIVIPKLANQNEVYKRVLNPGQITTFQTSQNKIYKEARVKLSNRVEIHYNGKYKSEPVKAKLPPRQIRAAFYVNWDAQSFSSLRDNIDKLNMVMPEWLFIAEGKDTIITDIDSRALKLLRDHRTPIIPMLSNYYNGNWDGKAVHEIISSPDKRKKLIAGLLKVLKQNKFAGVNIDFESLVETGDEYLSLFQKELYDTFHKEKLTVTQDIAPFNTDYNLTKLAASNDYILLMAYDFHFASSAPGAVAPISWIESALVTSLKKIPARKIILGIPTYGYDWPAGDEGIDVTYQEAVATAKESEGAITFDHDSFNLNYSYSDDNDHAHQVWFTDAASCYNIMRLASDYNTAGAALWRLGGEDERLWRFYGSDLSRDSLAVKKTDLSKLDKIDPAYDVDFEGEGEVIQLAAVPDSGIIDLSYDTMAQIITDQKYERLPSNYVMKKFGKSEKEIVLSFDDGPDDNYTPRILDILKEGNVPAAFFVIGLNAEKNLNILKRIYDEGHEIGNHSFSHPNLADISTERAELELKVTRKIIESVTGHTTLLFRPPYNADAEPESRDEVIPIVLGNSQNYLTVCESIDPTDWEIGVTADSIVQRVINQLSYGNILLLHDAGGNREETIKALPVIIKYLKDHGYRFVSVAGLIGKKRDDVMPPLTDSGDIYYAKINWIVAEGIFWSEHFFYALFFVAIILSVGRLIFVAVLSFIHKKREGRTGGLLIENPLVSIIVPAYNEEVNAVRTVETLLKSSYRSIEIVFVDDGSKDNTYGKVLNAFEGNEKIKVYTKQNGGKASALNFGISVANGDYLVCIDADTQLDPKAVSELMRYFTGPEVAAVAGNVKVGNKINLLTRWQSIEYITSQNFDRRAFDLLNCITVVPGAIGAFRKDALIKVGKFSIDTLAEDCDLTMRLLIAGYRVRYAPEALAFTEAPETIRMFLKQRFRWTFGILQSVWKHKETTFNRHFKGLGLIAMPNAIIYQFFLPIFSPLVDILLVFSLISGNWMQTLVYYLLFTLVDLTASLLAFSYEGEDKKQLIYLIPQRVIYRFLMFWVLAKSLIAAVKGTLIGWGVLKRTGTVRAVIKNKY